MTPDDFTIKEFFLEVGDGHQLYVYEWGNPKAKTPIIHLHGGPGGYVSDRSKGTYDPHLHRVIFFDQRGGGRSLPYGELAHNTTQDLIADIEKIADHCKLPQFVLRGGSWGSTLALAYALAHPKRVKALVLHGIWTSTRVENDWLEHGGVHTFYPEVWERYVASVPTAHRHDPTRYHFKRVLGNDLQASRQSAADYSNLESGVMSLDDRFIPEEAGDPAFDPTPIRTEIHYIANGCFMPDRYILDNAHKLTMPVWLVQGRYDMVCPPRTAYELHQKLPNSHLLWTIANHRGGERETDSVVRSILLQFGDR